MTVAKEKAMLSPREKRIAGAAWMAGWTGRNLEEMAKNLEEIEASGQFDKGIGESTSDSR